MEKVLGILITEPFIVFIGAVIRGALLFYPAMLFMGMLHSHWSAVPALSWQGSFALVAVTGLLFSGGSNE